MIFLPEAQVELSALQPALQEHNHLHRKKKKLLFKLQFVNKNIQIFILLAMAQYVLYTEQK